MSYSDPRFDRDSAICTVVCAVTVVAIFLFGLYQSFQNNVFRDEIIRLEEDNKFLQTEVHIAQNGNVVEVEEPANDSISWSSSSVADTTTDLTFGGGRGLGTLTIEEPLTIDHRWSSKDVSMYKLSYKGQHAADIAVVGTALEISDAHGNVLGTINPRCSACGQ